MTDCRDSTTSHDTTNNSFPWSTIEMPESTLCSKKTPSFKIGTGQVAGPDTVLNREHQSHKHVSPHKPKDGSKACLSTPSKSSASKSRIPFSTRPRKSSNWAGPDSIMRRRLTVGMIESDKVKCKCNASGTTGGVTMPAFNCWGIVHHFHW